MIGIYQNNLPSQYSEDEEGNPTKLYHQVKMSFVPKGRAVLLTKSWDKVSNYISSLAINAKIDVAVLDCFEYPQAFGKHGEINYPALVTTNGEVIDYPSAILKYLGLE